MPSGKVASTCTSAIISGLDQLVEEEVVAAYGVSVETVAAEVPPLDAAVLAIAEVYDGDIREHVHDRW